MSIVEQLRMKLATKRAEETRLNMLIEGGQKLMCEGLNPLLVAPADIDMEQLDAQFDQLKGNWGELLICRNDIANLKRELGER